VTLNRLTCLLAMTLTVAVGTSHADPLKTHDQYLRHYETGFYSGLGAEISLEADAEKSDRDEPLVNEEFNAIPDRYAQLGLTAIEQLDNFQHRRQKKGDIQSIIFRDTSGKSYLFVFNRLIPFKVRIDRSVDEEIKAGVTTICLADSPNYYSGSFKCRYRVEAIFPLKDMEEEKRVIKFLRTNN